MLSKIVKKTDVGTLAICLGLCAFLLCAFECYLDNPRARAPILPAMHLVLTDGVDVRYSGLYSGTDAFDDLVERIHHMRDLARRRAQRRLGIPIQPVDNIVLRFADLPEGVGASCRTVQAEGVDRVLISLSVEHFTRNLFDTQATLVHEYTHALMLSHMGLRSYHSLPRWFREGIAVWSAEQIRERTCNLVAGAYLDNRDARFLPTEVSGLDRHLMDAMLFAYIERNFSLETVQQVVSDVMAGVDPFLALEANTWRSFKSLQHDQEVYAEMFVQAAVAESGLYAYQQASALFSSQPHLLGSL